MKLFKENLVGKVFGDLTVLRFLGRKKLKDDTKTIPFWHCECVCGNFRDVVETKLKGGLVYSCKPCGLARTVYANSKGRTGIDAKVSSERLYKTWCSMKQRCYNKNSTSYKNYGGKGVTVCDDWITSYKNFREWALLNGYSDELTIDRLDVNGNYEPENCRWVTLEDNNKESFIRHYYAKTGLFSKESFEKVKITNRKKYGCNFNMYFEGEFIAEWGCLKECAEYICELKSLSTEPSQIKKNISACLHGKRKKCHGFTFKFKEV